MNCISNSLCYRCANQTRHCSDFVSVVHSFQFYSWILLPMINISLFETPFLCCYSTSFVQKNCKCFCVFVGSFSVLLCKSNVILLSSFDLKASQVSFSGIGRSLIAVDSRLSCYYCFWYEFVVFLVSKTSFHFQIVRCYDCLHFLFRKETCW